MRLTFIKQGNLPLLVLMFLFLWTGVLYAKKPLKNIKQQSFSFEHPGILHNAIDLERIKSLANSEHQPWKKGYQLLKSNTDIAYMPSPAYTDVYRDQGINSESAKAMTRDAQMAYRSALMWAITGDITYANTAKSILNSWSSTLQTFSGGDAKLCAAWYGFAMVNAAEILRYTNSGWTQTDIQQAEHMFRNVIYPVIENFQRGWAGNWDTAITKCIMGIGVFLNDEVIFNNGVNFLSSTTDSANGTLKNYIYDTGQCWESGRDQEHVHMGLGGLAEACEIGEKQGLDLYGLLNNRLLKGYEYMAKYNLGYNDVPYTANHYGSAISNDRRGEFQSGYEMIYNHYFNRKGISAHEVFYTKKVVDRVRSLEGGELGASILLGYGTLLFNETTLPMDDNPVNSVFNYVPAEGDYRTGQASSGFNSANNFEVYQGGAWVTASAAIGLDRTVLIRDGHEGLLTGTSQRNVKKLLVGEGYGAILAANISNGSVSVVNIIEPGRLNSIPVLNFVNGMQANGSINAEAVISKVNVTGADIKNSGSGYTYANVSFSGGGGSGASATVTVIDGKIAGVAITNSGSGYTSIPTMTITGDGINAEVTAKVGIVSVNIINGGNGYTIAPSVIAGTRVTIRHAATLNAAENVSFQHGASAYTGYASGSHTGILSIGTELIAEGNINFLSHTIATGGNYVNSSMTVKFTKTNTTAIVNGPSFTFSLLELGSTTTLKITDATIINVAENIVLNTTGKIDATEGVIGFIKPFTGINPRVIVDNTFKNGIVNKMIVNSDLGVTLNQTLVIKELGMQSGLLNIPATGQLQISKINGGGVASYINTLSEVSGQIAKVIFVGLNTHTDIPLGNSENYLPVSITPQSVSDFELSVLTGLTDNGLPGGNPIVDKSKFVDASYHLRRTDGTGDFAIKLGFPASLKGSNFSSPSGVYFGIAGYDGINWAAATGSGNNTGNYATTNLNSNDVGVYRVEIDNTLPLKFVSIEVKAIDNNKAEVSWKTLNEVAVQGFEIQRSADGEIFNTIGNIKSDGRQFYKYVDKNLLSGTSYYRVKSIEIDGYETEFSPIAFLLVSFNPNKVTVYPNPVKGNKLYIQLTDEFLKDTEEVDFVLVDITGRQININRISNNGQKYEILIPDVLKNGIYQLFIQKSDERIIKSVLIYR
ncbi:alginate lyase family protein [Pseudopedobacter beijingensis]|uniref:Alginate lyase family protein n=1 Tax=Pseudopedobacter beijingensis TaxID=1207056 RepID=A0ABW4IEE2_9SPHI